MLASPQPATNDAAVTLVRALLPLLASTDGSRLALHLTLESDGAYDDLTVTWTCDHTDQKGRTITFAAGSQPTLGAALVAAILTLADINH